MTFDMKTLSRTLGALFLASNTIFIVSEVQAQGAAPVQLEEIVVTARKRQESLQDVPIAVTALDANTIESGHVSTVSDLEKFIPNVDFADNPFAGQALGATIRGVGFSDLEKSFEPAVGFSIDGVFLASNTGAAIDAFDIEQVEVLRGPQGTLFGRNTVGGVINVTRSRPTGETGVRVGTRFTNNGGKELMIVANTPQIGEVLSTKFYAFDKTEETFADNVLTGEPDDQTDITSYGAAFLFEPNDDLEALISVDYFDDDSQGPPTYNLTQPGELFCDLPNLDFLNSIGTPGVPDIIPGVAVTAASSQAGCASTSIEVAEASDFDLYTRAIPFVTSLEGKSVTANVVYDLSDNLTLTSITGYRETDEQLLEENLGGPNVVFAIGGMPIASVPILYQNRVQEADQFSQELRLSGELNDRLTFVSGLYYMQSEYGLTGGEFPGGGGFGTTQSFGGIAGDEVYNQKTTAYAVFVDGTFNLTDNFLLSGGLRYSNEKKEADKEFIVSSVPGVPGTSVSDSESWSSPTGRLILQYNFSDDTMIYGGLSRGFRSGGYNGRAASVTAIGPYDPETVDSLEVGMRTELFDNKVRVNPTVFAAQYKDKQEENLVAVPGGGAGATETTVQNASEVDIHGAELEVLIQATDALTIRGAFGLTDAEFSEFLVLEDPDDPNNNTFVDVKDSRNLRAGPDQTISVGVAYVQPVFDGRAQLVFNADYSWADELVTSAAADPLDLGRDTIDSQDAVDFAIKLESLSSEGPNMSISAYINDAFDDGSGRLANAIVVPGTFTFGVGAPTKVYGLEATVEF